MYEELLVVMTGSWKEQREALGFQNWNWEWWQETEATTLNPSQLLSAGNMDSALSDPPIVPESLESQNLILCWLS